MDPKTSLLAAAVLAVAATSAAHPYLENRTPVAGVDGSGMLGVGAGASSCETVSPGLPTSCATGGLGVAVFGTAPFNAHGGVNQTEGTCRAQKVVSSAGDLAFVCGNDRDDDFLVTNVDPVDDDSPGSDHGTNANGHDDQAYVGTVASGASAGSLAVCFTHDTDLAGGHQWDDLAVFVAGNLPTPYAGVVSVVLDLDDRATDC
jgi:hypothetical protein